MKRSTSCLPIFFQQLFFHQPRLETRTPLYYLRQGNLTDNITTLKVLLERVTLLNHSLQLLLGQDLPKYQQCERVGLNININLEVTVKHTFSFPSHSHRGPFS